ncbi:MAG TPA: hypothetical protein VM308_03575 [Sphingomicrobium sp.]|nr:hypothetical protein [Sphingomicrobium sp.]
MTRLFLAAGVAALAIAAPSAAKPGGGGEKGGKPAKVERGGGGGEMRAFKAPRAERTQEMRTVRPARAEREQARNQQRMFERQARSERKAVERAVKPHERVAKQERKASQQAFKQQERFARQDRKFAEQAAKQQQRLVRDQARQFDRVARAEAPGFGIGGCPPGLAKKAVPCVPPGQAKQALRVPVVTAQNATLLRAAEVERLNRRFGTQMLAPATAATLLGVPLSQATALAPLAPLPGSVRYLYPDTDDYYYRYGDGYLFQVDRGSELVSALMPLLGGYLPGQYLPASYMNSYVPNYYGLSSFYPDSPYGCSRYYNGVVYQVDCASGLIEDVVPVYASGYGVGQLLPSAYNYYNVPTQYRSLYYPTSDQSYWYAPGAIYQYDPETSLITSIAALLSPGFSIGQPLPAGYSAYNVPLSYRSTYYDTPNAWYRYNNGYIYQVDPTTQLVTAIVASLLT